MRRPRTIALDFDCTIYGGPYVRADLVDGPPVDGAIEWLRAQLADGITIIIHTCRLTPSYPGSNWPLHVDQDIVIDAIKAWLAGWLSSREIEALTWWVHPGKPGADMYLDDKGVRFEGVFPVFDAPQELLA